MSNEPNSPIAKRAHAYAAGRKAWEAQEPREAPHNLGPEERLKWLEGYDEAMHEWTRPKH